MLDDLHREHDEAIERLKRIKDQEMEAVVNRHSHSRYMYHRVPFLNVCM